MTKRNKIKEEKYNKIENIFNKHGFPISVIQSFFDKKYSHKLFMKMIKRDYENLQKDLDKNEISLSVFRSFCVCNKLKLHKNNQRTSTAFRKQYDYPKGTSLEKIESDLLKSSRKGQEKAADLRRKNKTYNKQYTVEYWMEKENLSTDEAEKRLSLYKRQISPFCKEFYIKKGLSEKEAVEKSTVYKIMGAYTTIKKCQTSNVEKDVERFFKENKVSYSKQFKVSLRDDEKIYNKRFYSYDFLVENTIIEVNGLFWHAHPSLFKENDFVNFPGRIGEITAKEIWEADKFKKKIALSRGYNYIVVWENEIDELCKVLKCILK